MSRFSPRAIQPSGTDGQVLTTTGGKTAWADAPASGASGGVPPGGAAGQVLTKLSATDYDAGWQTPSGSGGGGSGTLSTNIARLTPVVVTNPTGGSVPNNLFDGVTAASSYVDVGPGTQELVLDFSQEIPFRLARLWMYWADNRIFQNVALYASNDGAAWTTVRAPANWQPSSTGGHLDITMDGTPWRYLKTHTEASDRFPNSNEYVEFEAFANLLLA